MSVSTEVQRTLVKSPPELWSELSNPDALARHLAELGEIRITAVEPETKVEWEAEGASGVVHLKQSGWGTKVTLSLTRETPISEEPPQTEQLAEACSEPEAVIETQAPVEPEPEPEPEPTVPPRPVATIEPEPEPRQGFFARLFGRRKAKSLKAVQLEPEIATPEIVAMAAPEPIYPLPPIESETEQEPAEPPADLAAELAAVEAQMAQETTELLRSVLDRLGAAHHRPFSRG